MSAGGRSGVGQPACEWGAARIWGGAGARPRARMRGGRRRRGCEEGLSEWGKGKGGMAEEEEAGC